MNTHHLRRSIAAAALALGPWPGLADAGEGGSWQGLSPMSVARQETGAARIGDKVYVVGGLLAGPLVVATGACEAYDIAADQWSLLAPLPQPRDHPAVTAHAGKLYVIGGFNASFFANPEVFVYDPASNTWSTSAPLPQGRSAAAAVSHGGKIYVFGGWFAGGPVDTTFIFDPATGWSVGAPMPTAREHLTATVVDGHIYVIGGRTPFPTDVNERYDPVTNQWSTMAKMPTARSAMGVAAFGARVFVCGGEIPTLHEVNEVYNTETDHWTCQEPMAIPRHGMAAVALDDRILFPGGGVIQGLQPTAAVDSFVPGPTWEVLGPCPGPTDFRGVGLTPSGVFAILAATGAGNPSVFVPGCGGIPLGLDLGSLTVAVVLTADAQGELAFTANIPASLCGVLLLQLLDVAGCQASNVTPLG